MLPALVGDGRIGGCCGEVKDGLDGRDGGLLVLDDIALVQHGGERCRGIVQRDLRQGGETACLAVQRIGNAPSRGRQVCCAQHFAEGALAA